MFGPRDANGQWIVARLISVQPGQVKPIEDVSEDIRAELAGERAQMVFTDKMDRLDEDSRLVMTSNRSRLTFRYRS